MLRRATILLLLAAAARAGAPAPEALVLVIADQHSAYDRTAQLVAAVDRLQTENPGLPLAILLDGDTLEYGNVVARRSAGTIDFAMFAALARRAPTILNLGNHEPEFFDLAETVRRIEATGVRVVSNINDRNTGRPFAPASTVLQLGREAAVVIGVTTDRLATYRVAVRPSLDLADPAVWAKANFPKLLGPVGRGVPAEPLATDAGEKSRLTGDGSPYPLPIILSHCGIAADRELLKLVPAGTLFAGAHDHQRFVQPFGRTVYFHSGSWNQWLSLVWLCRDAGGQPRWEVEQMRIDPAVPADPAMAAVIADVRARFLKLEDMEIVGRSPAPMSTDEAGRFAARAVAMAVGADAVFVGNTTFGAGLPAGEVNRLEFDACVRFEGTICMAEVDGFRLRELLAAANLGPDTPFAARKGEYCFAVGPERIDPAGTYRVATTDWGARNTARYFGNPAIAWTEQPDRKLKVIVQNALNHTQPD